ISREWGDIRYPQSSGDPRQRRRQYGVWGEWVQRAVVAEYQLSRAVSTSRPSPDPRGRVPATHTARGGERDHRGDADRTTAGGSVGVSEIYRWHSSPLPLRGGRV